MMTRHDWGTMIPKKATIPMTAVVQVAKIVAIINKLVRNKRGLSPTDSKNSSLTLR